MSTPQTGGDRRQRIADSAIRIISRDGVRALTHRAVDLEAGIPPGSTSHHARTRLALLELIVDALAARTMADADAVAESLSSNDSRLSIDDLGTLLASFVEGLASRGDDMRARYALILELHDTPRLRHKLTAGAEIHAANSRIAAAALARAGLPHSDAQVDELIALTDSLVFQRIAIDDAAPITPVFAKYLSGAIRG